MDGKLTLEQLRECFRKAFSLDTVDLSRLKCFIKRDSIGFHLFRKIKDFDLNDYIFEDPNADVSNQDLLEDYLGQLISLHPFKNDYRAKWQFRLLPKGENGKSVVIFRIHHVYGDGIGLLKSLIFNLADKRPPNDSIFFKATDSKLGNL